MVTSTIQQQLQCAAEQVVADNWRLPEDGSWTWVGSSLHARVARIRTDAGDFYFKAFLPRDWFESSKARLRGSRAQRCVDSTRELLAAGFSVPGIVAADTTGQVPWVVMESARGVAWGDCLASFLACQRNPEQLRRKWQLIAALGAEVGRLHRLGFVHGDLRPSNVLVDINAPTPRFHFIDNERSRRPLRLPTRERLRNLVQINLLGPKQWTRRDRLRFLYAYCAAAGIPGYRAPRLDLLVARGLAARPPSRRPRRDYPPESVSVHPG